MHKSTPIRSRTSKCFPGYVPV